MRENRFPNFKSAFVGIVEETGSLFAMSPDRFPLVVFSDANAADEYGVGRSIDPPPGNRWDFDPELDLPLSVDSVVKRAKLKQLCRNGSRDKRCYVGVRELESSQLSRLLDGAPTVPLPPYYNQNSASSAPVGGNASVMPPVGAIDGGQASSSAPGYLGFQTLLAAVVTLSALFAGTFWAIRRKKIPSKQPIQKGLALPENTHLEQNGHAADTTPEISEASVQEAVKPSLEQAPLVVSSPSLEALSSEDDRSSTPRPRKVSFKADIVRPASRAGQTADEGVGDGEGEESEGEGEGDAGATAGKKKAPRRKRGKKKKASALPLNGSDEAGAEEKDGDSPGETNENVVHVVSPSAIVVPPPASPTPVVPSLIVSDTILGKNSPLHSFRRAKCLILRFRVSRNSGVQRLLARPCCCCEAPPAGLCYSRSS